MTMRMISVLFAFLKGAASLQELDVCTYASIDEGDEDLPVEVMRRLCRYRNGFMSLDDLIAELRSLVNFTESEYGTWCSYNQTIVGVN